MGSYYGSTLKSKYPKALKPPSGIIRASLEAVGAHWRLLGVVGFGGCPVEGPPTYLPHSLMILGSVVCALVHMCFTMV